MTLNHLYIKLEVIAYTESWLDTIGEINFYRIGVLLKYKYSKN